MEIRKVTGFGNVLIPKAYREALNIEVGEKVWVYMKDGNIVISKIQQDQVQQIVGN
ncbi:AbrB/MazE/SpoVT family DNA-binding domain-containing protein [Laceyella putida]|uniref:AbrB/MazE/SpoVT family DNA-binding domain-containing protein n=1 Tax=Laceyella putida TaxID=110101 RepID=A0ABW2RR81_9BACL